MKRVMVSLWCVLILVGLAWADEKPWQAAKTTRTGFVTRGTVVLHLGAGDATVVQDPDAKEIVVTTETQSGEKIADIKIAVKVSGSTADVKVYGPKNHFRYKVELPTAADLKVRMSAGDLTVNGVDGNADIELHAGDCNIGLKASPSDFGPIDLSVKAGDVSADAFGASKGGLFRHFHENRVAKYRFHAHVGAGDLNVK
jgi:hypothetical protein